MPDSPGGPTVEELRARLEERERRERKEVARRLTGDTCRCLQCRADDLEAQGYDRPDWGRWNGI